MADHDKHPFLYHLVQADLWRSALDDDRLYYPPTYDEDGFTHATARADLLLNVANHFYQDIAGDWLCLRMTRASLAAVDAPVVFEATAPVGDKDADFEGTNDELFPHIYAGIAPAAVVGTHAVSRATDGAFLAIHNLPESTEEGER